MVFKEITKENFDAVCALSNSASGLFVAANERSLAQAWLYRDQNSVFPYAIYEGDAPVGFVMLRAYRQERRLLLWRLMVDGAYMNRGVGRAAVEEIIRRARIGGLRPDHALLRSGEHRRAAVLRTIRLLLGRDDGRG